MTQSTTALTERCRDAALQLQHSQGINESQSLIWLRLLASVPLPSEARLGVVHVRAYWQRPYGCDMDQPRSGQHRVHVDGGNLVTLELWDNALGRHKRISVESEAAWSIHESLKTHARRYLFMDSETRKELRKKAWTHWASERLRTLTGAMVSWDAAHIKCAKELFTTQQLLSVKLLFADYASPASNKANPISVRLVPRVLPMADLADTILCPNNSPLLITAAGKPDSIVAANDSIRRDLKAFQARRGEGCVQYGTVTFSFIRAFGADNRLDLEAHKGEVVHVAGEGASMVLDAVNLACTGLPYHGGKPATFANPQMRREHLQGANGQSEPAVSTVLTLNLPGQASTITVRRAWRSRTGDHKNIKAAPITVTPSGALGQKSGQDTVNDHICRMLPPPRPQADCDAIHFLLMDRSALRQMLAPLLAPAHGAIDVAIKMHGELARQDTASATTLADIIRAKADSTTMDRVFDREILPEIARQISLHLAHLERPYSVAAAGDGTLQVLKHAGTDREHSVVFGGDGSRTLEVSELSKFCIGLAAHITLMRRGVPGFNSSLLAINEVPVGIPDAKFGQLLQDVAKSGVTVMLGTRNTALAACATRTVGVRDTSSGKRLVDYAAVQDCHGGEP
jgi:hypothetical protein